MPTRPNPRPASLAKPSRGAVRSMQFPDMPDCAGMRRTRHGAAVSGDCETGEHGRMEPKSAQFPPRNAVERPGADGSAADEHRAAVHETELVSEWVVGVERPFPPGAAGNGARRVAVDVAVGQRRPGPDARLVR